MWASYSSGIEKQSVTEDACWENIAKLIPSSTFDAPSGKALPGEYFITSSTPKLGELFSCCLLHSTGDVLLTARHYQECIIFKDNYNFFNKLDECLHYYVTRSAQKHKNFGAISKTILHQHHSSQVFRWLSCSNWKLS